MIVFPAIDLKQGRCVRLLRGEMSAATVFNYDPADQARRFLAAGARPTRPRWRRSRWRSPAPAPGCSSAPAS
ncbi:MAG: hypothetical protein FJX21_07690, partial [Alphaproteobacteria bacterium]|nr:hypothetical protein [Alphaproteobacteria bacterium]